MTGPAPKRSPFFKAMAVFLSIVFSVYNLSFAVPEKTEVPEELSAFKEILTAEDVGVAIDVGTVKEKHNGDSGKIVVHIQDAHCHYEAQNNINKILDQVTNECGIDIISVEGAEGIVDTTWFKAFPDSEIRKEVATYFMKKGEITGAEFFSITSDFSGTIFGAETREHYVNNLRAFTDVYPYREPIEKYFRDLRSVIAKLKSVMYSPELRELDGKIISFEDKEIELSQFAEYIYGQTSKRRMDLNAYPNFKKLVETLEYEKKINFDIVDQERSNYIDALSKKIAKEDMAKLVAQSIKFKKGHIKAVDFYSYLRDLAKDNSIDMVREYPNLFYYYIYTKLYDGIDNEQLFKELDVLGRELKKGLFKDPSQETLDRVSTLTDMYLNLANIELTNECYDLFKEYSVDMSLENMVSFVETNCEKYGFSVNVGEVPALIGDNMPKMVDFYEIAIKRDNALIENTLKEMEKSGKERCVLIAGGFHTRGIKDILSKKGVSYVVVTPKITKDLETPYIKVLTNQRTSLEDIISESASMPGMGITASREEIVQAKSDMLAPPARVFYTIPLLIKDPNSLRILAETMGAVEGRNAYESAKTTYEDVVKAMVTGWLMKAREKADPAVWEQAVNNWQLLMSAYLKQFEKSAREAGIALKADLRAPPAEATEEMLRQVMGTVSTEFSAIFQSAVQNVQRTTPGQQAVRTVVNDVDDLYESLTPAQHEGINAVIKSVIDAGAYQTGSLRVRVRNEATGKMEYQEVVVYRLEGLKEAIETYNVNPTFGEAIPLDLEVHPGRGVDHSGSNLYMSRAAADALNNRQLQRLARHEVYHILNPDRTEQQAIDAMKDDLEDVRERFRSVEAARVAAKGIPEVSVYDESALESKLAADTSYGAAAAKHIQAAKTKIAAVKSEGNAAEAARLENELRQWMKTVEARRGNIDRMQNVLTDENYNGYDVIIVSSSTPDEAEYQQKVLEGLFAGRQTSNKELGNQVCILSVLDESEGGQIIGQGLSWLRAVEMYRDWAIKNGLEATDLDALFSQDKIKIAVYHNGGKGERASPATQSLGNSRGAQKIVGTVTAANGERADIELIPAVILSTAGAAITNNGSRVDTFWANQVSFGTIDLANLQRSNSQFDKLVIKLPADPKKKDLFDYGTAVINDYIVKFLANKSLTVKNPATGQFEDNPKFEKELSELLRSPNGSFDFGSFSMSRDMHYALIEYWKNKGIFDKIERDKKAGIARDIDPAFVQIVVPLMSGLMGKDMPAGLPTADELRVMTPEQREAALNDAYAKLVALMPADHAAALDKIYNAQKKGELDKDKRDSVLESIEFLIMYPQLFGDRSKVVGSIDLGADSHWFAYKRMLDLSNEKFLMLSDILGKNVELNGRGEVVETPLDALNLDEVRAEDARRIRGINRDAVATFVVNGELITLTLDQVREGWRDAKNDITVKGSIIHGNTVLMPGSKVINSVISDSQGKIVATNSYVESSVAVEIDAANSIVYKASDKDVVKADKEIVADAYRAPDREGNVQISDERFPAGQTRMRAPIGYDPKPSNPVLNAAGEMIQDDKRFGDNRYSFQDIRNMECNRAANDEVETTNKDAVRMGAGMVLPGMAAGLSFEEAYGFVVKEAAEKIERIREMDPKYVSLKNGTSGMRGMVAQSEAESALIKPEMTPEQIENTRERISRQIASEGFMSDMECYINVRGFIRFLYAQGDIVKGSTIVFGGDRRPSTPRIAAAIQQAIVDEGCVPECAGLVSSPALAYYAVQNGIPSVMITGSHIPADRNGIKFTKKSGEVLKSDEMPIASGVRAARNDVYGMRPDLRLFNDGGMFKPNSRPEVQVNSKKDVMEFYVQRYLSALPSDYLKGARMVLYQHSAVGRDALEKIFRGLGAEVITIGRSETFVPVDTEKVSDATKTILKDAAKQYSPTVIVSADGDTDRPLLADENGDFLTGDRLGGLVTRMLGDNVRKVAVPDTTNDGIVTMLRASGIAVEETQVGSPYVVKELNDGADVGWEANGGFLLARKVTFPGWPGTLEPLPTRDAALPLIMATRLAMERGGKMSELIATLPPRFNVGVAVTNETAGCEAYNVAMGKDIMKRLSPADANLKQADFMTDGTVRVTYADKTTSVLPADNDTAREMTAKRDMWASKYLTKARGFDQPITRLRFVDGVKVVFLNPAAPEKPGTVAHIRASGNAPDFRLIVTEDTEAKAKQLSGRWTEIGPEVIRDFGLAVSPGLQAVRTRPAEASDEAALVNAILAGKPFFLTPHFEPKVWGEGGIGEYWYGGETGQKSSGATMGNVKVPMASMMSYVPEEMLGKGVVRNFGDSMPLVKILTPRSRLSSQFHDKKNELWIVTKTEGGNPSIILGFSAGAIAKYGLNVGSEYQKSLENFGKALNRLIDAMEQNGQTSLMTTFGDVELAARELKAPNSDIEAALKEYGAAKETLESFYNYRSVKPGDVIPIPAGTLHALGAGVEIIEPQIPGPTQSLEDGATYPVRYAFPGYERPSSQKTLDIDRVGEIVTEAATDAAPVIIEGGMDYTVERLPGGFEDKGLEVHRVSMKAGSSISVPDATSFHNLVAISGRAFVEVAGERYEVPRAQADGRMLIIPATSGSYRIVAEENTVLIDTFTPVPGTRELIVGRSDVVVPGTDVPVVEERLVFADFPTTTSSFDQLSVLDRAIVPRIIENRPHELLVQDGMVNVVRNGDEVARELGPGEKMMIPADFGPYELVKVGPMPASIKVNYEKTEAESIVYSTYESVRKHMKEVQAGQVDLIFPAEMFVPGGKDRPGSAAWEEEQLRRYVSDKIRIRTYSANLGLQEVASLSVSDGTIGILVATESSLKDADNQSEKVKDFLTSKRGVVRVLGIPDIQKEQALENRGWFFAREVAGTSLLLASVTPESIAEEGVGNAADDLQKLMTQLTGRSVPRQYMYFMLAHSEMAPYMDKLPVEFRDGLGWLRFLVQNLLLKMPIKPFDATEQLEQRRKIMWSV